MAIRPSASSASSPTQATGQCAAVAVAGRPVASTYSHGSRASPQATSSHPARRMPRAGRGSSASSWSGMTSARSKPSVPTDSSSHNTS